MPRILPLLLMGMLMCALPAPAQNLVVNGDLESYTTCPFDEDQTGFATGCMNYNPNTTSDFGDTCGWTGIFTAGSFVIHVKPSTGDGALGMWARTYTGPADCLGSGGNYIEGAVLSLSTPLIPGDAYELSFEAMIDDVGFATWGPSGCFDIGFLPFQAGVSDPPVNDCACSLPPTYAWSAGTLIQGTYQTFSTTFTATSPDDRVLISPFQNASSAGCTAHMYMNFDNVVLLHGTCSVTVENDTLLCPGEQLLLDASALGGSCVWQDGSTGQTFNATAPGLYWVDVTVNNCTARDTILLGTIETNEAGLADLSTLCMNSTLTLSTSVPDADGYLWSTGDTLPEVTIAEPGTVWVEVDRGACTFSDTTLVLLEDCDCHMHVPTAFTPDGDGINDGVMPVVSCDLNDLVWDIYDRWGENIHHAEGELQEPWDGHYKGRPCPVGLYVWKLTYRDLRRNDRIERLGHLALVR